MATIRQSLREQWESVSRLRGRKRWAHIWQYYHWQIIVCILAVITVVYGLQAVAYDRQELVISGMFVNNATTPEGYAHLREDYVTYTGKDHARAELVEGREIHFEDEPLSQNDAAAYMIIASSISAQSLDYIITDTATLRRFDREEITLDLSSLLPEETLAKYDTLSTGTGIIGLSLNGTAFAEQYPFYAPDSWIMIVRNAPDLQRVTAFLDYLLQE